MDTYFPTLFPRQKRPTMISEHTNGAAGFALFCKDTFQGFMSALLTIVGSIQAFTAGPLYANADLSFDALIFDGLANSRLVGGVEIIAAALLFLSTTRSIARTLGVVLILGFIMVQNAGLSGHDITSALSHSFRAVADVFDAGAVFLN